VIYKKKHAPLKVQLADAAAKTILVDMSLQVDELVLAIGEKLKIEGVEEFSLKRVGAAAGLQTSLWALVLVKPKLSQQVTGCCRNRTCWSKELIQKTIRWSYVKSSL